MINRWTLSTALALTMGSQAMACDIDDAPVVTLDYGSRYQADSKSRSEIDEVSDREVTNALKPIDKFIQNLAREANRALSDNDPEEAAAHANCVVDNIARWAEAEALSDLATFNARMSIGSRKTGIAMSLLQVADLTTSADNLAVSRDWLADLAQHEITFWEEEATFGSRRGNLRAWSALGTTATAILTEDADLLEWSRNSAAFVLCTASPDGSLPQEMRRAQWALHYQLHAVSPLVLTTALMEREGLPLKTVCADALERAVIYAVNDLETGTVTEEKTGHVQSYFDGTEELESFELAWAEVYLTMFDTPEVSEFVEPFRPLRSSKLGGDQVTVRDGVMR